MPLMAPPPFGISPILALAKADCAPANMLRAQAPGAAGFGFDAAAIFAFLPICSAMDPETPEFEDSPVIGGCAFNAFGPTGNAGAPAPIEAAGFRVKEFPDVGKPGAGCGVFGAPEGIGFAAA